MSSVTVYAQFVEATVSRAAWQETYFALVSLKASLQSISGWERMETWVHEIEGGNVKLVVSTSWRDPSRLDEWLRTGVTVEHVLQAMEPAPTSLVVDVFEKVV